MPRAANSGPEIPFGFSVNPAEGLKPGKPLASTIRQIMPYRTRHGQKRVGHLSENLGRHKNEPDVVKFMYSVCNARQKPRKLRILQRGLYGSSMKAVSAPHSSPPPKG